MFIDEVKVMVKAGDGGNGCMAFRREKFVAKGGPSGGDGGRGGNVYLVASQHHNTLLHLRYNPEHKAERGRHGEGSNCTGREGESIEVEVPVGTVVYDWDTAALLHDFTEPGQKWMAAKGGRANGLVELIDLYPTLVESCGLPAMAGLEGRSLGPQLRNAAAPGKRFAISQHPHPSYGKATHMGYAVRTATHRYVEWRELPSGAVAARELYDHAVDPAETRNRVDDPSVAGVVRELAAEVARLVAAGGAFSGRIGR